jgi:hypothetical protein
MPAAIDFKPCVHCGDQLCVEFTPCDSTVCTSLLTITVGPNIPLPKGNTCFCGHSKPEHRANVSPVSSLPPKGPCQATGCEAFLAPVSLHLCYIELSAE